MIYFGVCETLDERRFRFSLVKGVSVFLLKNMI